MAGRCRPCRVPMDSSKAVVPMRRSDAHRHRIAETHLTVNEIFHSIQRTTRAGDLVFVADGPRSRVPGATRRMPFTRDGRCRSTMLSVVELRAPLVEITGANRCCVRAHELMERLLAAGHTVLLETEDTGPSIVPAAVVKTRRRAFRARLRTRSNLDHWWHDESSSENDRSDREFQRVPHARILIRAAAILFAVHQLIRKPCPMGYRRSSAHAQLQLHVYMVADQW